jgi:apolipoprotein N-acyltransferase
VRSALAPPYASLLRALTIGAAAGLCIGLGGAPTELYGLAWLGPMLLLLGIERWDRAIVSTHHALAMGLACGFAANAWTMRWAVELFERFGMMHVSLALIVATLLFLAQAMPFVIASGLAASVARLGVPTWIALPLALVVAMSGMPMIFPWRLATSQVGWTTFVQSADLGGPPLLDLFMGLAACAGLEALRRRDRPALSVATLAIALPLAYGAVRLPEIRAAREAAPMLRVGIVQHGLTIDDRRDTTHYLEQHEAMVHTTRVLEDAGADLVVWPEGAYGFGWPRARTADPPEPQAEGLCRDGVHGPLLFGAITTTWTDRWNSVLVMDHAQITGVADKVHLMAFGEYVPFWDYLPFIGDYVGRGLTEGAPSSTVLDVAGTRVGILNCYEDLLPDHAREVASRSPAFLSNHTNDAWFGDTEAPGLHRFLSTLRTVETRRDLVRAVGTGPSGLTMATGERDEGTPIFCAASRVVEVRLLDETTWWVRLGDVITMPSMAVLLALAWVVRRRSTVWPTRGPLV